MMIRSARAYFRTGFMHLVDARLMAQRDGLPRPALGLRVALRRRGQPKRISPPPRWPHQAVALRGSCTRG